MNSAVFAAGFLARFRVQESTREHEARRIDGEARARLARTSDAVTTRASIAGASRSGLRAVEAV